MTKKKVESITGFYVDQFLLDAINDEYVEGDWDVDGEGENTFLKAYRNNTDGIAEKIRDRADEYMTAVYENERRYMDRIRRLESERVSVEYGWNKEAEKSGDKVSVSAMKSAMLDSLIDLANTETSAEEILHAVYSFETLLEKMEGRT